MEFVELSETEFRKFEQKNRVGNFYQSVERANLRRRMGWDCYLLGLKDGKKLVSVCFLMARKGSARVAMGPIMDFSDIALVRTWIKKLLEFCRAKQWMDVEVFPPVLLSVRAGHGEKLESFDREALKQVFLEAGFSWGGETIEIENKANRWMCVKDLSQFADMAAVRASYKKNVRNKLRKVSPLLEVHKIESKEELPDFLRAVSDSDRKNGIVSRRLDYWEDVWDSFGDSVHFIVARKKDTHEVVCGRVYFDHPNEVVTFVSGTVQRFKKYNGMTFLQDWTLNDCLERGYKRINFYGVAGDFSKDNHLVEFKNGFDVKYEEYVGGFHCILDEKAYRISQIKEGALGLARRVKRSGEAIVEKVGKRQTKVVRKVRARK